MLRDRVNETAAEGSPAMVKSRLQALIHEIRVDHSASLSCAFGGRRHGGRCGSRTIPVGGGNGTMFEPLVTPVHQVTYRCIGSELAGSEPDRCPRDASLEHQRGKSCPKCRMKCQFMQ